MAIAQISKEELADLQARRNAIITMELQYILAKRGFSAHIGEILRRYRRESDERLRVNLQTGEIEVVSPSTVGMQDRVDEVTRDILNGG